MLIGRYCNPCDSILLKQTASIFNFGSKGCKLPASELNDGCSIVKCLKCLLLRFQKKPKTNAKKNKPLFEEKQTQNQKKQTTILKKQKNTKPKAKKSNQKANPIYIYMRLLCFFGLFSLFFVVFSFAGELVTTGFAFLVVAIMSGLLNSTRPTRGLLVEASSSASSADA